MTDTARARYSDGVCRACDVSESDRTHCRHCGGELDHTVSLFDPVRGRHTARGEARVTFDDTGRAA